MIDGNQEYPKINIVTVVFNGIKTLEQTILSVVNQTYENIEYIIIDGGSTDGTVDLIRKYEDRIAYWVSEPDNGIYDAMNKGINKSSGDYIYFLGADDFLCDSSIIENVSKVLCNNTKIDLLSGSVWVLDRQFNLQIAYSNKFFLDDIYKGYRIPHQGLFIRSSLLKKHYFNCNYKIVADYDLFLKLYFDKSIRFQFIDEKIAFYANDGVSSTSIKKRVKEDIEVMKAHKIPSRYIDKYVKINSYCIGRMIKNKLKYILHSIGLLKSILRSKGWVNHN